MELAVYLNALDAIVRVQQRAGQTMFPYHVIPNRNDLYGS
jgi:hypothetical protein